ncbi:MAG: glycosyltransferase family 4 protein [Candidatus Aenigmarchaeota archaeon]|nr:glycosyltransferase family 4 protein [Candidatus Aenigmarchaeota archaeon]
MRIQVIAHNKKYSEYSPYRWDRMPILLGKNGHVVDHVLKKDWRNFYPRYMGFKPDIVISAGVIGFLPAFLKKIGLIKVPVIHDWVDDYADIMPKKYSRALIAFLEKFTVMNSDIVTTQSMYRVARGRSWGKDVKFFPQGVNTGFGKKKVIKLKGKFKLLYSGTISHNKRVDRLIEAVEGLGCELYLIGERDKDFAAKAGPNVHFIGKVKNENLPAYLKSADVLVLTMDADSTLKMYEYLKAGKPILGIRGKLNYILKHKENAYLTEDLREGAETLMKDKRIAGKISKGARKFKVFTWEQVGKMYSDYVSEQGRRIKCAV